MMVVPEATPALQALLGDLGVADSISTDFGGEETADAVAMLGNHPGLDLRRVRRTLRPGGVLYLETRRWGRAGASPAGLRARLTQAGFSGIRVYAVAPHPRTARVYVPLDLPAPLRWYASAAYDPPSRARHVARKLIGSAGEWGWRLARLLLPWYCATAVAGPPGESSGTPALLEHIAADASAQEKATYPVLLCDTGNRVVMLPFTYTSSEPVAVLKIPKVQTVNDRTENEQRALVALHERLPGEILRSIPEPGGLTRYGEVLVGMESYLPGTSLKQRTTEWWRSPAAKVADLESVAAWLTRFHRASLIERITWEDAAERWLHEAISAYTAGFGEDAAEQALFRRARACSDALPQITLPIVWQHRDFNIWNVVMDAGKVRVLDWEGLKAGPPLTDLIHFISHWHEAASGAATLQKQLASFRSLWVVKEHGMLIHAARDVMRRYMLQLDLDRRLLPLVILYTWLELALRRSEQQRDHGLALDDPRLDNPHIAYIQELATHAATLFPDA